MQSPGDHSVLFNAAACLKFYRSEEPNYLAVLIRIARYLRRFTLA